ncbi:MAG: Gfo/Idh/MocA family oxidoreductase [Planctomycetes bacterium]|nr:Gfo/Idh/MocA family oxidoreductase [Planctomycetota bacterium]
MSDPVAPFRCAVLSVAKHDYVARGVASHPRFELVVVADDPDVPDWIHERNQLFADSQGVPYVRNVERALRDFDLQVAIVSPQAERHCDLSIRAALAGKHVIQDKPLSTCRAECERLVSTIDGTGVRFLMWNRNGLPAIQHAQQQIAAGAIGRPIAIHADFYFAKDSGPPRGSRLPGYPPMDWQTHLIASHIDGSDGGLGRAPMGEMAVEGIYPLGYIRLLTGAEVHRVFARSTAHFHQVHADNDVEDLASVTLEMERGIVATVAIGRIGQASHPSGGEIKLRILGTAGALVINEARPDVGVYYRNQPPKEHRQRRIASENDFLLADNFAQAIDTSGPTIMDAQASQRIYATFEAALKSCRTGQVEAVVL